MREALVVTGLIDAATTGTVVAETGVTAGRLVWIGGGGRVGRGVCEDGVDGVVGVEGKSILICEAVVATIAAASLTAAGPSFCCLLRLALRWLEDFFVFAMPCCCW